MWVDVVRMLSNNPKSGEKETAGALNPKRRVLFMSNAIVV
jgi:hypothetical protein